MLSKLSRVLISYSYRYNSTLKSTKSVYNCTIFKAPDCGFHSSRYVLEKVSPKPNSKQQRKKPEDVSAQSIGYYTMAVAVLCGGLTFAAVPLYRLFCQVIENWQFIRTQSIYWQD